MTTINKLKPSGMYELYSHIEKRFLKFDTRKAYDAQVRKEALMPDGIPKWIRCYDTGPDSTADRYTVVYTKKACTNTHGDRWFLYVGMSSEPFHPMGFGQHGETNDRCCDRPTYGHLGKKIKFENLPEDCKKLVISDYRDLWDIK